MNKNFEIELLHHMDLGQLFVYGTARSMLDYREMERVASDVIRELNQKGLIMYWIVRWKLGGIQERFEVRCDRPTEVQACLDLLRHMKHNVSNVVLSLVDTNNSSAIDIPCKI